MQDPPRTVGEVVGIVVGIVVGRVRSCLWEGKLVVTRGSETLEIRTSKCAKDGTPMHAHAQPAGSDYRVRLDAFEGPLDLLLFLIRKNEVDLHDIPIATITDQYLGFVSTMHVGGSSRLDIDEAGEFLVMAATLTEIKSRMLLPRPVVTSGESADAKPPEDPRAELVRQLVEYKKYRDAADLLERRGEEWSRRMGTARAGVDEAALAEVLGDPADMELEDLNLFDLVTAFQKVAETVNFERLGDHQVTYDDTPIELHAADILTRLEERKAGASLENQAGEIELRELLTNRKRGEMVGLFLALLELARNGRIAVRQDKVEGAILLRLREATPSTPSTPSTPEAQEPGAAASS
jgi:segregation and condensation protein A